MARTARRINPSSSWPRCAPFRAWCCCGPATPTKSSRLTDISCNCATSRRCWSCPVNRCRLWTGTNTPPQQGSRGALMSWPTPPGGNPELILIASGSEVILAVEAHEQLVAEGIRSRVVSMPSWDIFEHQPQEYRDTVLPPNVTARVAVEQASTFGWERYVGSERPGNRHANLWRLGAAQGTPEEIWFRTGCGGHRCEGPVGGGTKAGCINGIGGTCNERPMAATASIPNLVVERTSPDVPQEGLSYAMQTDRANLHFHEKY